MVSLHFPPLILFFLFLRISESQYRNDTTQYSQLISEGTSELIGEIQSHPDVNLIFYPDRALINSDYYVYDYPESATYRIGILIDPCRYNSYNCCVNVFGTPEYPALLSSNLESERAYKYIVIASDSEVSRNYYLVDEGGSTIPSSAQRSADDFSIFNTTCVSAGEPYSYCQGRNYAFQRSSLRPPCMDNNSTLNILDGCYTVNGTKLEKCIQVAYTSNAFIPQCGEDDDDHCGTYLEIHMAHGTPYQDETDIISEVKIEERNVSGYYTTTLPTIWMKNESKVLCSYSESVFRVGSLVYIKSSAPVCCCPPPFDSSTRVGSFQCPIGSTGDGAYAYVSETLADTLSVDSLMLDYPFCPIDLTATEDRMMCSTYDVENRRAFTRNCTNVTKYDSTESRSWTSVDLEGEYDGKCDYYSSCALTLDSGKCRLTDLKFTFIGQVGIVTAVDNDATIPQVWVTFNNGRTSYQFSQEDVKLETNTKSMYEIWWVVRSKSWFTVQKRKGFNVTYPSCTFDTTNNRYLPYAILKDESPLDTSAYS